MIGCNRFVSKLVILEQRITDQGMITNDSTDDDDDDNYDKTL